MTALFKLWKQGVGHPFFLCCQVMLIKKWQMYFMLAAIAVMIVILLTVGRTSDICKMHKELFLTQLESGLVVKKFVDKENHSFETVVIEEHGKSFTLLLIPDANDKDFERIRVNDRITKRANSFQFVINNDYEFQYKVDCDFK